MKRRIPCCIFPCHSVFIPWPKIFVACALLGVGLLFVGGLLVFAEAAETARAERRVELEVFADQGAPALALVGAEDAVDFFLGFLVDVVDFLRGAFAPLAEPAKPTAGF